MIERKPDRPSAVKRTQRNESTGQFNLSHSVVIVAFGPAGPVARVEHENDIRPTVEYAGPLPTQTLRALREVQT